MIIHNIKSTKQENGLWGTPLNLYTLDMDILPEFDKQLLISAIIIKFSEIFDVKFKCNIKETEMIISYGSNNHRLKDGYFRLHYDDYRIVDDNLYYLENDNDKIVFSRMQKLKKLCGGLIE